MSRLLLLAGLLALCAPAGAQQVTVAPVPRGAMPVLAPAIAPELRAPLAAGLSGNVLFSPSVPGLDPLLPSVSQPEISPTRAAPLPAAAAARAAARSAGAAAVTVIGRSPSPAGQELGRQTQAFLEALAERWREMGAKDAQPLRKVVLVAEALDYPSFYRQAYGLRDPVATFTAWRDRVLKAGDAALLAEFEQFADAFPLTKAPGLAEMLRRQSYPIDVTRMFLETSFFEDLIEKASGKGPKTIAAEAWFALTGGAFYMPRQGLLVLLPQVVSDPAGLDRSVLAHEATHHLLDQIWTRKPGQPDEYYSVIKEALADYGAASFLDDPVVNRRGDRPRDLSAPARMDADPAPTDGAQGYYARGAALRYALWSLRGKLGRARTDQLALAALADLASAADSLEADGSAQSDRRLVEAYLRALRRHLRGSETEAFARIASEVGAGELLEGGWTGENRERLERLIQAYGKGGPLWDANQPPLATFDWDNTMIRNDIGEAVFFHSIREMRFKFERGDRFWNLIPKEFGRDDIRASYEAIQRLPVEQAKQTPEYQRYRKLFHQAYEQVKLHGEELNVDYGWLVQLMAGFTVPELEHLADEVIAFETGRGVGQEAIADSGVDPSPLHIPAGIRPYAEMFLLARRLQEAGWDVRIVSATAEWIVARFARLAGMTPDKVHGVRTRLYRGKLTTRLTQKTWRQGKADTILRRAGRPSRLAAGDSNSDIQMLQLSQGESLVIDLRKEPLGSIALKGGWLLQPPFPVP